MQHRTSHQILIYSQVLLESAASLRLPQKKTPATEASKPQLLVFSAKHSEALQKSIDMHKNDILANPPALADTSFTLSKRREFHNCRAFCVASASTPLEISPTIIASEPSKLIFTFTGQGAQWAQMGAQLLQDSVLFRTSIRDLDTFLASLPDPPAWTLESMSRYPLLF